MTKQDRFAEREAQKYDNPIPSREFILDVLESSEGPLSHKKLCSILKLDDDTAIEALRRRLIAMVRDGQLISDRKGAFGRVDKMDLAKGRVLAHRDGYGFVRPADGGPDVYLTNRQMRKVFDGDEVLIRKGQTNFRGQVEGHIVEVLVRNTTELVGQLMLDGAYAFLVPDNPKISNDIMLEDDGGAKPGQIVVAELVQQPGKHQRPLARVKEVLGNHLAPGMEIDVAIRSHGIPHIWPQAVDKQLESMSAEVKEADKANRVDLRDLSFVTIDGEDARDFDDAVYCETKSSGGWRLYVAIADVSHYVELGSALDEEAQKRATSVYFPRQVVPMLPELLSNGLCSLNPLVDRLCMVCEMTISASGRVSGYKFYEALMHSKARLTYTEVGKVLEERAGKAGGTPTRTKLKALLPGLDCLHDLYLCLHGARAQRGAIEFETVETRIEFDEERKIKQIVPVHRNDAHRLIEECMLAANVCAAKFLEQHKLPALYRVHEPPKAEKLELLHSYLAELGLSMPARRVVQPADYQDVMQQAKGRSDAHLIQTVMLRSMNQAVYQPDNLGHFGLAYKAYAHFTSPIRRYPDLLVHRAIRSVIRSQRESRYVRRVDTATHLKTQKIYPYDDAAMDALGEQCSTCERRADDATRDVVSWLKCEYLQERVGEHFDGVITAVTAFGLFVELKDLYVEGLIHITALPQDYYHHSAVQHRLTGERTGRTFHLGGELRVQVARVNLDDRKIDFDLVEVGKSRKKGRGAKPKGVSAKQVVEPAEKRMPRKRAAADNTKPKLEEKTKRKPKAKKRKSATAKKSAAPDQGASKNNAGPKKAKKKHSQKVKKSGAKPKPKKN
ncbi:ribonuclease R [Agaribacterium sp. ZY112]|uniref:ribonuclease R n=1 Tax=Agaribacterium sp. ZY112 TaxID=3233574 RepID=UPI0035258460